MRDTGFVRVTPGRRTMRLVEPGDKIMRNTKTLALAALTALSLGVGAAMAQESPGGFISDYPAGEPGSARAMPRTMHAQPQAGASDVERQSPEAPLYGAAGTGN
jgi:hypothetical protein